MIKLSESKYMDMITHCREVYTRHGSQLLYPITDEINSFYKSGGGG